MAMMQPPSQSGQSPSMPNMGDMPGMHPNTPEATPKPQP
jgi:hypothetical protein